MTAAPTLSVERQFDEKSARKIEAIYLTRDVTAQRERVLELLAPKSGECVLDIGCGPGLLACELGKRVGANGKVCAIDLSVPMLALAQRRCAGNDWITIQHADAAALPFPDHEADAAVINQVYEYLPDVPVALRELARVLKLGGRALIMDTDWESAVWASADDARMRRIIDTWDEHVPNPRLPRELPVLLREAGFELLVTHVLPLLNIGRCDNTYSAGMTGVIAGFVAGRNGLTAEDAANWRADLLARGEREEYFFSLNRYVFMAVRSDRART